MFPSIDIINRFGTTLSFVKNGRTITIPPGHSTIGAHEWPYAQRALGRQVRLADKPVPLPVAEAVDSAAFTEALDAGDESQLLGAANPEPPIEREPAPVVHKKTAPQPHPLKKHVIHKK